LEARLIRRLSSGLDRGHVLAWHRRPADTLGGEHPRQPAGLSALVAADRHVAKGDVAALTENETGDREDRVQVSATLSAAGVSKSTPSSRSRANKVLHQRARCAHD
jgi:hypothetical protein